MHAIAVQLAPVLGAEKSKVPFYIAGGLLVAWALFVSLGVGARRSNFPEGLSQQRGVIAVTVVLVLAAVSTAVITAGGSKSEAKAAAPAQTAPAEAPAASTTPPQASSTATAAPPKTTKGRPPKATTGTPAPASSPAAHAGALKLAADPTGQLAYDTKQLSAKAGTVKIAFTNSSPVEHDVTIAQGSKVLGATPAFVGGSKTLTVALKPGKYTFYCSVPGHRQAGMEGTLNVS
jgi:plastocyanin